MLPGIEQAVELIVQIGVAGGGIVVEAFECQQRCGNIAVV
jgi:hypothetical protein